MSVLRESASNDEIEKTVKLRIEGRKQSLFGFASFPCRFVRDIATERPDGQEKEQYYSVLDTDEPDRPNHADIFATFTKKSEKNKIALKGRRSKLLELLADNISSPQDFRHGAFNRKEWIAP